MTKNMFKKLYLLALIGLLTACDDGDIFVQNIEFDSIDLEYCEGSTDFILYKVKTQVPFESLSAKLPLSNKDYLTTEGTNTTNLSTSNTFNYRTYNGDPTGIFCNSLPPASPNITSDAEATSGVISFITTLEEDDNDGIPAELEDLNGNGDLTDDDTDGDGIPNYLDSDDDGDNIPTSSENPDPNGDEDLSDALDTDNDNTPNYLDNDDDDDGIITRYEDSNMNNDPSDDITDPLIGADYLNSAVITSVTNDVYRDHTKTQTYQCNVTAQNINLINNSSGENIAFEDQNLGTITTVIQNLSYEVSFN